MKNINTNKKRIQEMNNIVVKFPENNQISEQSESVSQCELNQNQK